MDESLHRYFVSGNQLLSSCDFIPEKYAADGIIYEVIRILQGKPLFFNEHLRRLQQSALLAGCQKHIDSETIKESIRALITANAVNEGNIKLVAFNSSADGIACWFMPHFYPDQEMYLNGVHLTLLDYQRENPALKSQRNDYKQLVSNRLKRENAFELLLVKNGLITEGSKSNVFFISNNLLITAPDNAVLSGITRQKCIELANNINVQLVYNSFPVSNLAEATSCFITGTSPKLLPVRSIDSMKHFVVDHPLMHRLMALYEQTISNDVISFHW